MVFAVSGFRTTSIRSHITSVRELRFHGSTRRMVQKRIYIYIYIYCGHPLTSLPIPTSPSRVMTGRPPPRGRPEGPPPRGRGAGVPWVAGWGKTKIWITFWRNGTRVNRRAALIRRLDDSPARRFAGIAGALDNDNPSVRRGGQRPSGTTRSVAWNSRKIHPIDTTSQRLA